MTDDAMMRFRLQKVAAYRELRRAIRRTGRGNVVFALLMLFFTYVSFQNGQADWVVVVYGLLALAELAAGLFKSLFPSAEGILLDALILLMFAGFSLGRQGIAVQAGGKPSLLMVFIGLYLLMGAVGRFREYGNLRRLFADRPTADQIAWFDDLVAEIRYADPDVDTLALDLPTKPKWKAKLLGDTVFVVAAKGESVVVAGPDEFELRPARPDKRTGADRVQLRIHDEVYPEFEIDHATRDNYTNWRKAQPR